MACVSASQMERTRAASRAWSRRLPDPVSAGTTFESPVIETGLEAHAIHQTLPEDSIFAGGNFRVYALQARYAVDENWAIIATKDGYIDFNPDSGPDESGYADIAGGAKFKAYSDPESGVIITPGLIIETDGGDRDVFQGNGDGVLRPFVSAGWDMDRTNLIGAMGYNLPLDSDAESSSLDYHLHLSYEVTPQFLPLVEINGITYTSNGRALGVDFEGGDLINLGATDVSGNTVVSGAIGAIYRPNDVVQVGLTYEQPLTSREDLLDERFWFAVLFRL